MKKNKVSSFKEFYEISLNIAGKYGYLLKQSYMYFIISYIFQGLSFSFLFPLLNIIFTPESDFNKIYFWLIIVVVLSLLSFIFKWLASSFEYSKEIIEVTHDLRINLAQKIKTIPLQRLYRYRTGSLNSILSQNVDESVLHMGVVAGIFFEATVVPVVILIAVFFIDPTMALILLLTFPVAIFIYKVSRKRTKIDKVKEVEAHSLLEANTLEYIQGLPTLRSLNQVGVNAKNLQLSISKLRNTQKRGIYNNIFPLVMMNSLIEFVFLFILCLGSIWVVRGEFSIGSLLALLIILNRLSEPLSLFLGVSSMIDLVEASFRNVQKLLSIEPLFIDGTLQKTNKFDIKFEKVMFHYDKSETPIINNLNITIKEKSLTAIVGSSGSGKTTITKLIMRYDDPQNGTIKIGGVNIKSMSQTTLMSYITVVFQDVYLFDDTIFNNICMGKLNATKEEVIYASKSAFCHDFIMNLPQGYNTKIGEIGGTLSGGERQRLSIARAILKAAPIVILDEPTSSLDTQSELLVQNALDELIKNKTVIVVAHRLSTISHAANILVIEDGKLKEQGTHQKLLERKGRYYGMLSAQQRVKEWNLKESYEKKINI